MSGPGNPITSGASNLPPIAEAIITRAFRIMGVINDEETPNAAQYEDGRTTLNSMVKEWQATGLHVWTEEEAILFLQQNQRRYLLGASPAGVPSPDHCAPANDWLQQQLTVSAIAGATSVTVSDPTGIEEGDQFGLVLNTGAAFWTTVKSNPTSAVIQLNNALPSPASAGAFSFAYETNIVRPLRVPFARRLQYAQNPQPGQIAPDWGGIITPLSPMMSRREYFDLPQPNNPGLVTQAYYNPARTQGELWVWNVQQNANFGLRFTYYRPIQYFLTTDDAADFPDEWDNILKWNLAYELGPAYSVPSERWDRIVLTATKKLELVEGWDREPESVYFGRASPQSRG